MSRMPGNIRQLSVSVLVRPRCTRLACDRQYAAVLGNRSLTLFQRHVIWQEELMKNLNRVVLAGDRFTPLIPCHGETGTVSFQTGAVELN